MTSNSKGGLYFPVVRFKTESQEWITQQLEIGYNPPKPEGDKMRILYDPDDPSYIQLDSTFILILLPRILTIVGVAGFVLSLLVYIEIINMK